jgi:hypothetical protein
MFGYYGLTSSMKVVEKELRRVNDISIIFLSIKHHQLFLLSAYYYYFKTWLFNNKHHFFFFLKKKN